MSWRTLVPTCLGGCPARWRLTRALLDDGPRDLTSHLVRCRRCAAECRSLARDRAAVLALPRASMSGAAFDLIEARLRRGVAASTVASAPTTEARRSPTPAALFVSCGIAAAVAVFGLGVGRRGAPAPEASASWASIRAVGDASFFRASSPDEGVRLDSGTLELDVGPAPPAHRFRVLTDDAVVEAVASRLRVEAVGHMLVAVRVFSGYAEVRVNGGHASLRAGDEWVPRETHATEESADVVPSTPPTRGSRTPRPASFDRAWRLLNAGRASEAAEAFRDVEASARGNALGEDALFWRGVSLERADRSADARAVLRRFTSRFPDSERIGEASAMLGWSLLEAGDADGARLAFERAENDKVDRVRASARSGLARLGR
ncbi:MAG: hypothetical protein JWM82_1304 [Myxococcales bacterium]|nr:hypothetical protein [Myxococcales bacterium]